MAALLSMIPGLISSAGGLGGILDTAKNIFSTVKGALSPASGSGSQANEENLVTRDGVEITNEKYHFDKAADVLWKKWVNTGNIPGKLAAAMKAMGLRAYVDDIDHQVAQAANAMSKNIADHDTMVVKSEHPSMSPIRMSPLAPVENLTSGGLHADEIQQASNGPAGSQTAGGSPTGAPVYASQARDRVHRKKRR